MGSSQSQEDASAADDTAQDYQQADASTAKPGSSRARASPPPHAPPASEPSTAIVPADASMHVQDPTLQQRLVGNTPGGLGSLRAQCAYGAAESHFMLFAMVPCASGDRKAASQRWREHRRCVVYNPCYWCCWLPTMLLIVVGRWLHYLFGQHLPLREPEHERALLPPLRRQLLLQFALGLAELVDVVVRRRVVVAGALAHRGGRGSARAQICGAVALSREVASPGRRLFFSRSMSAGLRRLRRGAAATHAYANCRCSARRNTTPSPPTTPPSARCASPKARSSGPASPRRRPNRRGDGRRR